MAARDGDENISRYPSKWNRTEPIPIRQCGEDERRHTQMLYLQKENVTVGSRVGIYRR